MVKKTGYGVILWAIPYVTAIPLLPLMRSDQVFFKTIMIVEGSIVGAVLAVLYFRAVSDRFLAMKSRGRKLLKRLCGSRGARAGK